ncbi:MAG: prepilin-type N-terminal cleavage/methylation domain-containing protein [Planctomycetota bacterium]|nr:prepilin-type N-terminal cleavage/methylation domain-containing protein [Planctomycetota bacterium]
MRNGFTLVEMLAVIIVVTFAFFAFNVIFKDAVVDVPRSTRVVDENTTLLSMMSRMQRDIDSAKGLPEPSAGQVASDKLLLLEMADGTICYQLEDDGVIRRKLMNAELDVADQDRTWLLPNSKIEWRIWRKDGIGYAVEVKTHIRYKLREKMEKKMANSHLYFAGIFAETAEQK